MASNQKADVKNQNRGTTGINKTRKAMLDHRSKQLNTKQPITKK